MDSLRLAILAAENEDTRGLVNGLTRRGFTCAVISHAEDLSTSHTIDLLLIETENRITNSSILELTRRIKQERRFPVICLINKDKLSEMANSAGIDDFILKPCNIDELSIRIRRLLRKDTPKEESSEHLKAGDVVIDLPKCEVWVRGRVVDLTFTEYELLKLLMSKKGQVLTREVLLNKIWGYDYFGGDRTVDVHITRLRNKIEDATHSTIETVRNIGYRIKTTDD